MPFISIRAAVLGVLLLLSGTTAASAHDIWVTIIADGGKPRAVVNFGHPTERELAGIDRLLDLDLISPKGTTSLRGGKFVERHVNHAPVLVSQAFQVSAESALIATRYDNGYWVKTPQGYRNVSKRLFPAAEESLWAVKFSKTLLGPGAYATIVGHELELAPLEDPFRLAVGQQLHVRVLFRGAPLADAEVELGDGVRPIADKDIPRYRTNADGIAALPFTRRGPFVLAIDHTIPGRDPVLADKDYFNATLAFVLK